MKTKHYSSISSSPSQLPPALLLILGLALVLVAHLALGVGHGLALLAVAGLALLLLHGDAGVGAGLVPGPTLRPRQRLLQRTLK